MYEKLLEIMERGQFKRADMKEVLYKLWMATTAGDFICLHDVSENLTKDEFPLDVRLEDQSVLNGIYAIFRRRERIKGCVDKEYRRMFTIGIGILACAAHHVGHHLMSVHEILSLYEQLCDH